MNSDSQPAAPAAEPPAADVVAGQTEAVLAEQAPDESTSIEATPAAAPTKPLTYLQKARQNRAPVFRGLVDLSENKPTEKTDPQRLEILTGDKKSLSLRQSLIQKNREATAGKKVQNNFFRITMTDLLYGDGINLYGSGANNIGTVTADLMGDITETEGNLTNIVGLISFTGVGTGLAGNVSLVFGDSTLCLNGVDVTHWGDEDGAKPFLTQIQSLFGKLAALGPIKTDSADAAHILMEVEALRAQMIPFMSCLTNVLTSPSSRYNAEFEAAAAKQRKENFEKFVEEEFFEREFGEGEDGTKIVYLDHGVWRKTGEMVRFAPGGTMSPVLKEDINGEQWVVGLKPHPLDAEWSGQIEPLIPRPFIQPFNLPRQPRKDDGTPYRMLPEEVSWESYLEQQRVFKARDAESGVSLAAACDRMNAEMLQRKEEEKLAHPDDPNAGVVSDSDYAGAWVYDPATNRAVRKPIETVDDVMAFATPRPKPAASSQQPVRIEQPPKSAPVVSTKSVEKAVVRDRMDEVDEPSGATELVPASEERRVAAAKPVSPVAPPTGAPFPPSTRVPAWLKKVGAAITKPIEIPSFGAAKVPPAPATVPPPEPPTQ